MSLIDSEAEKLLKSRLESGDESVTKPAGVPGLSRRFGSLNKASSKVDSFRKQRAAQDANSLDQAKKTLQNLNAEQNLKSTADNASLSTRTQINSSLPDPILKNTTGTQIDNGLQSNKSKLEPVLNSTTRTQYDNPLLEPVLKNTTGTQFDNGSNRLKNNVLEPVLKDITSTQTDNGVVVSNDSLKQNLAIKTDSVNLRVQEADANPVKTSLIDRYDDVSEKIVSSPTQSSNQSVERPLTLESKLDEIKNINTPVLKNTTGTQIDNSAYQPVLNSITGTQNEHRSKNINIEPVLKYRTSTQTENPSIESATIKEEPVLNLSSGVDSVEHFRRTFLEEPISVDGREDNLIINKDDFYSDGFLASQKEEFKFKPQSGQFMIPHELYQGINTTFRKISERDVFSCLIRMSLGFHRDWCQASLNYIGNWIGKSHKPNISRTLAGLEAKGFISILVPPDAKKNRGTVYHIPLATKYLTKLGKPIEPYSGPGSEQASSAPTDVKPKKSGDSKFEVKTPDQLIESEYFQNFLKDLPAGQRDTERDYLERLLVEDKLAVIEYAVKDLLKNGIGPQKTKCLNPLNYLYKSGSELLKRARRIAVQQTQSAPAEDIPENHPSRMVFEMWKQQLSPEKIWEIIWPLWKESAQDDEGTVRSWIANNPENLEKQLTSYFIQIMKI